MGQGIYSNDLPACVDSITQIHGRRDEGDTILVMKEDPATRERLDCLGLYSRIVRQVTWLPVCMFLNPCSDQLEMRPGPRGHVYRHDGVVYGFCMPTGGVYAGLDFDMLNHDPGHIDIGIMDMQQLRRFGPSINKIWSTMRDRGHYQHRHAILQCACRLHRSIRLEPGDRGEDSARHL